MSTLRPTFGFLDLGFEEPRLDLARKSDGGAAAPKKREVRSVGPRASPRASATPATAARRLNRFSTLLLTCQSTSRLWRCHTAAETVLSATTSQRFRGSQRARSRTKSPLTLSDTKHFQIAGAKRAGLMGQSVSSSFDFWAGPGASPLRIRSRASGATGGRSRSPSGPGWAGVFLLLEAAETCDRSSVPTGAGRRSARLRSRRRRQPTQTGRQFPHQPADPRSERTVPAGATKAAEPMPRARPAAAGYSRRRANRPAPRQST